MTLFGRVVVAEGEVHGCTIVPTYEVSNPPIMSVNVFVSGCEVAQVLDQWSTFRRRHPIEMGDPLADIKRSQTAFVMGTDCRMGDRWVYGGA